MAAAGILRNLKDVALRTIEGFAPELYQLNQQIWRKPELCYQEKYAHEVLTTFFKDKGFEVTKHYTLETAFRASSGSCGKRVVGLICEYDALPGIGHACGHNLIAEVGVGAALGIKAALEASNQDLGKVVVLGTPAEEGGGGKVKMIQNGCFDEVDFCLMAHPKSFSCVYPTCLAMQDVKVTFHGLSSHAAAFPWEGINALDAAVMAYSSLSVLRQQLRPTWRLHGIITNGGAKPNIIPDKTSMEYFVRAPTEGELNELREKVHRCFESAAQATGIKAALEASNQDLGKVVVLGTPAEEGGGGKVKMIQNGCFDEVDFCLMAHPKSFSCVYPTCLAMQDVKVTFHGLSSHAAAFPWEGINALDAAVMAYSSLSVLRQQLRPTWRLHGIITNGGAKPNIIPDKTSMEYFVRAPTEGELNELREKVHRCFESAAQATGKRPTSDIKHQSSDMKRLTSKKRLILDVSHRTSDTRHQTSDNRHLTCMSICASNRRYMPHSRLVVGLLQTLPVSLPGQPSRCTVDIEWNSVVYSNMATNEQLAVVYQKNAEELGLSFPSREEQAKATFGSTDMGNVSHIKPSIHPYFDIDTSVANHTRDFTEAAGRTEAHVRAITQAKVMALTALDILWNDQVWGLVVADFEKKHGKN
ncbi:unnamed protein product [Porites evermanni]|uniref:Peptidase M20 dimerisation domain-containing protein n=1 Tax=Porites evermanni TaxID=104178 RepID=A0ABN8PSF6_9CNID|nr:unnamed protein product [Porites evermanni]